MAEKRTVGSERDLLHPLATLHWEHCHAWEKKVEPKYSAVLYNTILVLEYGKLYMSSTDLHSWTTSRAPCRWSSLTTYQSKFVLVGGCDRSTNEPTNQLWTSTTGLDWETSLPAMPTKRYYTSSVTGGSPEVLVVSGGEGSNTRYFQVVEVLLGGSWTTAAYLPTLCFNIRSAHHEGNFYFTGLMETKIIYTCSCDSLIASARKRKTAHIEWKKIGISFDIRDIASYSSRLITKYDKHIFGYSITSSPTWVWATCEGELPEGDKFSSFAVLPTGQLVIANENGVYRGTLSVSTFNPDTNFIRNVLPKLAAVMDIKIMSVLELYYTKLATSSGVMLSRHVIDMFDPIMYQFQFVREVMLQWSLGYGLRPPTWKQLLDVLQDIGLAKLSQQIEAFMKGDHTFENAYKHFIDTKDVLELLCLKFMFLGPPRLGKSTTRRRIMKEIVDLKSAGEADKVHGSTGTVECCPNMLVQDKSDPDLAESRAFWTIVQNIADEACLLFHSLKNSMETESIPEAGAAATSLESSKTNDAEVSHATNTVQSRTITKPPQPNLFQKIMTKIKYVSQTGQSRPKHLKKRGRAASSDYSEIEAIFKEVSRQPKFVQDVEHSVTAFLRMEDTGGQPELMDMLPALTIGPALYLLFFSYEFKLDEEYQVFYQRDSGETTAPKKSEFTLQEMLLCMLASISCFSASNHAKPFKKSRKSEIDEILQSSKSVVYIVGTHKDKVSELEIASVDEELKKIIQNTDFYTNGIVQFCSEDKLVVSLDNMGGGIEEILQLHQLLENAMEKHFKKLRIPAVWLLFSLCLRMREMRIATMETCLTLSNAFNMTPYETEVALWFLHHHAGIMMYFPDVAGLEDLVIIDIQVVYDSITGVILKAMSFERLGQAAAERFRKTGRFRMKDLESTTANIIGDLIAPNQLVALLEYVHIIALILSDDSSDNVLEEKEYIMPCVLENSSSKELDLFHKESCESCYVAPLFIHFNCGFTPMGLFPAAMACFISNKSFFFVKEGIKKNMVHFLYGSKQIRVTFISRSMYYEIIVSCNSSFQDSIYHECTALKREIENTLNEASSRMNYSSYMDFKFAFECYFHKGDYHLGIVCGQEKIPSVMRCAKDPQGVALQNKHHVWYGQKYKKQSEPEIFESNSSDSEVSDRRNYLSVFLSVYPDLVITVKLCVMEVADHCFSDKLISEDTYEQLVQRMDLTKTDKTRILLSDIRTVLSSTPTALHKFIEVLLQQDCKEVAMKLQQQLLV